MQCFTMNDDNIASKQFPGQRFVSYYTLVETVAFCYCYGCHDVIIELVRMAATVKTAAEETSMSAFYTQYVTKHLKM
uniref:Uncharacterized protein n=1 Tax=Glossina palpalis gambiensis TaxID=67801 RepID=A0A1B0B3U7_9MUSC